MWRCYEYLSSGKPWSSSTAPPAAFPSRRRSCRSHSPPSFGDQSLSLSLFNSRPNSTASLRLLCLCMEATLRCHAVPCSPFSSLPRTAPQRNHNKHRSRRNPLSINLCFFLVCLPHLPPIDSQEDARMETSSAAATCVLGLSAKPLLLAPHSATLSAVRSDPFRSSATSRALVHRTGRRTRRGPDGVGSSSDSPFGRGGDGGKGWNLSNGGDGASTPSSSLDPAFLLAYQVDLLVPFPCHPLRHRRPGATVADFGVEAGIQAEVPSPWQPTLVVDEVVDLRLHDYGPRVLLPRPAEVGPCRGSCRRESPVRADGAVLEDGAGRLVPVLAALRGDDALLVCQGLPHEHQAVLEHDGGVAEHEVDGAGDGALPVELPLGVGVKRVLVAVHLTQVEDGLVRLHPQGHRLVLRRARRVLHSQVLADEPVADHRCSFDRVK
ncbi:hypothetical protein BHE74_00022651 [Ensete ventricosum]|nr:hypothetical protein BHE74_00022651 [Ensete ventricosum]